MTAQGLFFNVFFKKDPHLNAVEIVPDSRNVEDNRVCFCMFLKLMLSTFYGLQMIVLGLILYHYYILCKKFC